MKSSKMGRKMGGFGRKAKSFFKRKKRKGFQNLYDNRTLCENLDEDPFLQFYVIAFIALVGFLLYKAIQKKR